ncbi:MAG TPA: sigma-54-dependent Fis family transcriptional regulator [Thermoanaerobaculia bacterium]|nr:sigma-54-dependent Fis family transcriptional regulator [Thermoanaerobaculia bacterium]
MLRPPEGGRPLSPESLAEALAALEQELAADSTVASRVAALAADCERLAVAERERRRRSAALEKLLATLAGALDVRTVFRELSAIAGEIIPHDLLELGVLTADRTYAQVYAASDGLADDAPRFRLPEEMRSSLDADFFILTDIHLVAGTTVRGSFVTSATEPPRPVEFTLPPERIDRQLKKGVKTVMRVSVRLEGQPIGALIFFSLRTDAYGSEDADAALRIADHIALAMAHQRLADQQQRAALLEARVETLTAELEAKGAGHRAIGRSKPWKETLALATKVAGTETTVLLTGESGTGKEVVARFLHRASPRAAGPFVALNCAALPEQLLESELFGSEKGAFTGATATRPGRIEQAAGGVLFLDEVGEMSLAVQAKLLRVLQEREFQRLGGLRPLKADVRVVAATNRDLAAAIAHGTFREDLFYRLSVFEIHLPPLRERPDDIPPLLEAFLEEIGRGVGRPAAGISREARDKLLVYAWPGNVRELRNAVERAVILCEGGLITGEHLPISIGRRAPPGPQAPMTPVSLPPGGVDLEAVEKGYVEQALQLAGNNKSKAARLLGLTRAQLYSRLEKYGL